MRVLIASVVLLALAVYQVHAAVGVFSAADDNFEASCGPTANARPPPSSRLFTDAALNAYLSALLTTEDNIPKYTFENDVTGPLATPKQLHFVADIPDPDLVNFFATINCLSPPCALLIKQNGSDAGITPPCQSANGRYANDGQKWLDVERNDDFVITFNESVKGFAFYASDIGDVTGSLSLTVQRADGSFVLNQDGGSQFVLYDANAAGVANSGVRNFWGIFTDSEDTDDWFRTVRFNKSVTSTNEQDGFGFDTFYALPPDLDIPVVDPCNCTYVYNFGDGSDCVETSFSASGVSKCACIRFVTDAARLPCEVEERICSAEGSEVPGGDTQSGGGNGDLVPRSFYDPSNPFFPTVIRY